MKFVQPSSIVLAVLAGSAVAFSPAGPRNSGRGFATPNIVSMSTKEIESAIAEETSDSSDSDADSSISPEFAAARDQVVGSVRATIESEATASLLVHFTNEYFSAASASFNAGNEEYTPQDTAKRFSKALELGMKYGMEDKFLFDVAHKAIREGVEGDDKEDFYKFGCEFFIPAMDLENSEVLGEDNAKKAFEQIKAGENVVFLANHQSEADPQVFSVLLDKIGFEAESPDIVYVAGHKVTTDTLAIPFSMGRNLLCIHSKKHIDADPESKPVKQKQNLAAMSELLGMFKQGGAAVWVAPSGGRDRRDLETGEVPLAPFDRKTVDMFRLMGTKSKILTHYYPLSMVSYDLCPPPDFLEAGVGESRNVRFCPIGIAVGDEVPNVGGAEGRKKFSELAFKTADENYHKLLEKIEANVQKEE